MEPAFACDKGSPAAAGGGLPVPAAAAAGAGCAGAAAGAAVGAAVGALVGGTAVGAGVGVGVGEQAVDAGYADVGGDFGEHLKTYKGFLNLLVYSAAGAVATLLLLYFFLAR